ncbi:MAG: hypothetical protein E7001_00470 [Coriobacteriaceae bacterium]|nr:hypothetical protein [Coriobacteriaceae bacterium]
MRLGKDDARSAAHASARHRLAFMILEKDNEMGLAPPGAAVSEDRLCRAERLAAWVQIAVGDASIISIEIKRPGAATHIKHARHDARLFSLTLMMSPSVTFLLMIASNAA